MSNFSETVICECACGEEFTIGDLENLQPLGQTAPVYFGHDEQCEWTEFYKCSYCKRTISFDRIG